MKHSSVPATSRSATLQATWEHAVDSRSAIAFTAACGCREVCVALCGTRLARSGDDRFRPSLGLPAPHGAVRVRRRSGSWNAVVHGVARGATRRQCGIRRCVLRATGSSATSPRQIRAGDSFAAPHLPAYLGWHGTFVPAHDAFGSSASINGRARRVVARLGLPHVVSSASVARRLLSVARDPVRLQGRPGHPEPATRPRRRR
jgi:hypothetical protein